MEPPTPKSGHPVPGDLLNQASVSLRAFLFKSLPGITADWWDKCVLRNLTEGQARVVQERGVNDLDGLDMAALLRVFDANYFDLSNRLIFPARRATG